jgi:hypothetical protein
MSLPYLCWRDPGRAPTPVPFLAIDRDLVDAWRSRVRDRAPIRAGIAWSGNPRVGNVEANAIDRRRSMPLATLRPLLDVPDVAWYSLQKGEAAAQLAQAPFAARIADLTADLSDFAETGALVEQLDVVISADTSVLHLACALGKPERSPSKPKPRPPIDGGTDAAAGNAPPAGGRDAAAIIRARSSRIRRHGRPQQMGQHQASQGRHRCQARQDLHAPHQGDHRRRAAGRR